MRWSGCCAPRPSDSGGTALQLSAQHYEAAQFSHPPTLACVRLILPPCTLWRLPNLMLPLFRLPRRRKPSLLPATLCVTRIV